MQVFEAGIAGFLVWIAIHAPAAAAPLLAGAAGLLVWAAIADGPFAVVHVVGLSLHRRGLVILGLGIAALPFVTGRFTELIVVVPCLLAAVVLVRTGLLKLGAPPSADHTRPPTGDAGPGSTEPSHLPDATRARFRRAGQVAGRAGNVVARQADVAVPRGARAAGKIVGRLRPAAPKR